MKIIYTHRGTWMKIIIHLHIFIWLVLVFFVVVKIQIQSETKKKGLTSHSMLLGKNVVFTIQIFDFKLNFFSSQSNHGNRTYTNLKIFFLPLA